GLRALKIRFHHADWRDDVAVVEAVRDAVGPDMEIMVDANQGWRMPGDLSPRWDVATAAACAEQLAPLRVHWLGRPPRRRPPPTSGPRLPATGGRSRWHPTTSRATPS